MAFGRSKKSSKKQSGESVDPYANIHLGKNVEQKPVEETSGPFDIADHPDDDGYIDLGALKIRPVDELNIRLEVEEKTQRIVAVSVDYQGSTLQMQVFAAPRKDGLWEEIRGQITESVTRQGGTAEENDGVFGPEISAKLPAVAQDGSKGHRVARFVGVDGPRWFLRGVIGGLAATSAKDAEALEEIFRTTIVVRGDAPMPPRELLTLSAPGAVQTPPALPLDTAPQTGPQPGERGPEITKIG